MTGHDPRCETYRVRETVRAQLAIFGEYARQRDVLVQAAVEFGVPKAEIAERTGLARSTIDRIVR